MRARLESQVNSMKNTMMDASALSDNSDWAPPAGVQAPTPATTTTVCLSCVLFYPKKSIILNFPTPQRNLPLGPKETAQVVIDWESPTVLFYHLVFAQRKPVAMVVAWFASAQGTETLVHTGKGTAVK